MHREEYMSKDVPDWEDLDPSLTVTPVAFFVTTLRVGKDHPHNRTVGWFPTLDLATQCMTENWGSLIEAGYYQYAVVEEVEAGVYPATFTGKDGKIHRHWWKAVNSQGHEFWEKMQAAPPEVEEETYIAFVPIG
jgi:hypothetical protein